jgi:hypothetical protein
MLFTEAYSKQLTRRQMRTTQSGQKLYRKVVRQAYNPPSWRRRGRQVRLGGGSVRINVFPDASTLLPKLDLELFHFFGRVNMYVNLVPRANLVRPPCRRPGAPRQPAASLVRRADLVRPPPPHEGCARGLSVMGALVVPGTPVCAAGGHAAGRPSVLLKRSVR